MSIRDFENSLKLTEPPKEKVSIYNNLGIAKTQLHDFEGAIKEFDNVINIDPRNDEAYRKRSDAKFNLKDYKGALDDCNKIIEINPSDARAIKNKDFVESILKNSKTTLN